MAARKSGFRAAIFPIIVFGKEYFVSRQKKEFEEYEINESYKTEERDNHMALREVEGGAACTSNLL